MLLFRPRANSGSGAVSPIKRLITNSIPPSIAPRGTPGLGSFAIATPPSILPDMRSISAFPSASSPKKTLPSMATFSSIAIPVPPKTWTSATTLPSTW